MQVKSIAEGGLAFIKLPFAIKILVLTILDWPLKTSCTVKLFASMQLQLLGKMMVPAIMSDRKGNQGRVRGSGNATMQQ